MPRFNTPSLMLPFGQFDSLYRSYLYVKLFCSVPFGALVLNSLPYQKLSFLHASI